MAPASQFMADLRFGRVDSVDKDHHSVTVKFEDPELIVEGLRMLVPPGDYSLPAKDTPVAVLLMQSRLGNGVILGCFYTENDMPPLDDAGKRAVVGDDLRLGAHDADKKVALAPAVKEHFSDQETHFDAVWNVITGSTINEPGNGAPSALQAALKAVIAGSPYPRVAQEVAAENVSAK